MRSPLLTLRCHDGPVGLDVGEASTGLASGASARKDFVDTAILCLKVLDLHDVLQAVDCAAKVDLPDGRVGFVAVLARVKGPLAEEGRVSVLAVAALLCMDPGYAEDSLLRVDPFQAVEATRIDHSAYPISHALRAFVVFGSRHGRHWWRFVER